MDVVHGYTATPAPAIGAVLAIGNFDGVHKGHRQLLMRVKSLAEAAGVRAGALIFDPHPREFFEPNARHFRLTPLPIKLKLFEALGLDLAVILPFDAALAGLTAEAFIEKVLVRGLKVREVVIGYDFRFGKGRAGDAELMRAAGKHHGFGVTVVEPVADGGVVYSSSGIRAALARGDVKSAAADLGYWWRIAGPVTGGAKRGTGLGFPTANIELPPGTRLAHGIYAVRVTFDAKTYDGAGYLGTRPTFDDGRPVLEVFLFDFNGDLYGRTIEVEFIEFLRGDQRFDSPEALTSQMQHDCARAREILAATAREEAADGSKTAASGR